MLSAGGQDRIEVWQIALTQPTAILARLNALLSSAEQARTARFTNPDHRDRYLVAHAALRSILASVLEMPPAALLFHEGAHGKPYLKGHPIHFNLTHAGELALVAVSSTRRLGIDLEPLRAMPDALSLAEQFHPAELVALRASHPDPRAFFACWTRKEAFVKATGEGLTRPLASFNVNAVLPGWQVLDIPIRDHCATLVAEASPEEPPLRPHLQVWQPT